MSDVPMNWKSIMFIDILDINGGTQPPKKDFIFEPQEGYVRLLQIRDFGKKPVPT
jgi:type I restriction enzyme S subunit